MDASSRVVYAVAEVVDPYGVLGQSQQDELKMGTFIRAEIQGRRAEDVVILPRSVLQPDDTVLVVNEKNELEVRAVTEPRYVYISSGIRDGERIVTTALDAPIPGTRLAIRGEADTGGESTEPADDGGSTP